MGVVTHMLLSHNGCCHTQVTVSITQWVLSHIRQCHIWGDVTHGVLTNIAHCQMRVAVSVTQQVLSHTCHCLTKSAVNRQGGAQVYNQQTATMDNVNHCQCHTAHPQ